eukprot:TRINITY_DN32882_c0_g1_i2.p3 TRINITY_DN32882_c0_g1~~TRINITY_DN32882_c0_g1_i2.p3  ORF type:complete len:123 (+),score=17.14 TRINITY_DN32882_c0_g1_i2:98-466(+)
MMLADGGEDDSPVAEARKARRELDKRVEDKIRGILSEEQIAKLPERRDEGQERMMVPGRAQQVIIRGGQPSRLPGSGVRRCSHELGATAGAADIGQRRDRGRAAARPSPRGRAPERQAGCGS